MTFEEIFCTITDDLEEKTQSGEYEWDSLCLTIVLEAPLHGYGIVVWCDSECGKKYFTASLRETNGVSADNFEEWTEVACESTDKGIFEELETVLSNLTRKVLHESIIK